MAYPGDPWAGSVLPLKDPPYYPLLKYSRKARLTLSNSDDEIQQEQDLRCPTIRRGWPTLPPLPVNTFFEKAAHRVNNAGQHVAKVKSILEAHKIEAYYVGFAYRLPMDEEPDHIDVQDDEYITLLVTLDITKHGHRIEHALIRIRSEFKKSSDTRDCMIEFLDFHAGPAGPTSMPITTTQRTIISAWEKSADKIIDRFLKGKRWLSLECVMRGLGNDEETFKPTIVITAPNAKDEDWWHNVLSQMREALKAQDFVGAYKVAFNVDLLQGTTLLCVPNRDRRPKNFRFLGALTRTKTHAYGDYLPMGVSIGLDKEDPKLGQSAGTMGGTIQLKTKDGAQRLGLTNWHAVEDKYLVEAANSSKTGTFIKRPGAPTVNIVSPSHLDHTTNLENVKEEIDLWKGKIGTQSNAAMYLGEAEKKLKDISNTSRMTGPVVAGSGLREVEGPRYRDQDAKEKPKIIWTLDWALFAMGKREANNSIQITAVDFPMALSERGDKTRLHNGLIADTWSHFRLFNDHDEGEYPLRVAKYGRTTRWTFGHVNATLAKINPNEDAEIANKYKYTNEKYGEVWSVGSRHPDKDFFFLKKGDSGSICIFDPPSASDSQVGSWLGLLFGYTVLGQGIMTPMDLVIKDIEDVTNYKVTLPRKGETVRNVEYPEQ